MSSYHRSRNRLHHWIWLFPDHAKGGSWHQVTSFILATPNSTLLEVFEKAYSYPDVYYDAGPNFTVKTNFWRVIIKTVPFYNYSESYIVYYSSEPLNIIRIWRDKQYFGSAFASIAMLSPIEYNVSTYTYAELRGFGFYYAWAGRQIYTN